MDVPVKMVAVAVAINMSSATRNTSRPIQNSRLLRHKLSPTCGTRINANAGRESDRSLCIYPEFGKRFKISAGSR